jgi:type II secretory pathway pseudopilin PulG
VKARTKIADGFSLVEVLMGLSIMIILAFATVELVRLSAKSQATNVGRLTEEDIYRAINRQLADKLACTSIFSNVDVSNLNTTPQPIDISLFSNEIAGPDQLAEYQKYLTFESIELVGPLDEIAAGLFRASVKIRFLRAAEAGSPVVRLFPIIIRERTLVPDRIFSCGDTTSGETFCTALLGQWDEANQECNYDKKLSCHTSGGLFNDSDEACDYCVHSGLVRGTIFERDGTRTYNCSMQNPDPDGRPTNALRACLGGTNCSTGLVPNKRFHVTASPAVTWTNNWNCQVILPCTGTPDAMNGKGCSKIINNSPAGYIPVTSFQLPCRDSYTGTDIGDVASNPPTCTVRMVECN